MSSVAFLNDKTESFSSFEVESEDLLEELTFDETGSEISIPDPICSKKEDWLASRIDKCSVIYDFKSDSIDDIEEKTECLEDLFEFFQEDPSPISRRIYGQLFDMFSKNLCRKVPQCSRKNYNPEEDGHTMEDAWPHLKLVYQIYIRFLEMSNLRLDYSKMYLTDRFIFEMMQLMDSEDPREKDMSKTVVHRIYTRFCTFRLFMRKELTNILLKFIYETDHFSGISEILQIYSCIINGLSLPLIQEFLVFLAKVLIPLHKVKNLSLFYHELTTCLINFLHKDTGTFRIIVDGLIKYWPKTNSAKEVLFLSEMEELLEAVDSEGFREVQGQLFTQVGKCVLSAHFQVVERSLSLFNNAWAWHLVEEHYTTVLPILMPSLLQRRRGHWNQTVAVLINNVLKKFKALDEQFFDHTIKESLKPPAEPRRAKKVGLEYFEEEEGSWMEETSAFGENEKEPVAGKTFGNDRGDRN